MTAKIDTSSADSMVSMANKGKKPHKKNPAAVALGRLGGKVSGVKKGFAGMTPEQRAEIWRKSLETRRANARKKLEK
jgi:hypothetical protein